MQTGLGVRWGVRAGLICCMRPSCSLTFLFVGFFKKMRRNAGKGYFKNLFTSIFIQEVKFQPEDIAFCLQSRTMGHEPSGLTIRDWGLLLAFHNEDFSDVQYHAVNQN